ncbi:hypothetical protein DF3PB_4800002 [uncultured Defluviicoccus sp.]|uniref:Uncharacterized protein n=1 Tax=metagenome TaxID=256318 RepID=A0A380TGT5_9ZZZZ|nr:hypothetical protein DF3PB_4800002 [uncultured Defluviicoccus sp.]
MRDAPHERGAPFLLMSGEDHEPARAPIRASGQGGQDVYRAYGRRKKMDTPEGVHRQKFSSGQTIKA